MPYTTGSVKPFNTAASHGFSSAALMMPCAINFGVAATQAPGIPEGAAKAVVPLAVAFSSQAQSFSVSRTVGVPSVNRPQRSKNVSP